MSGLLAFAVTAALGLAILTSVVRGEPPEVRRLAGFALVAHLGASVAQIWITTNVYGGGDMLGYHLVGIELSRLLDYDFGLFAPEVFEIVFQGDGEVPVPVFGIGSPTGTMAGISAFLIYVFGTSLYGVAAAISVVALFGKLALHRAIAADAPPELRRPLFIGLLLVPSVIFWSAGLLKESIIIGPLGFLYFSFRELVVEKSGRAIPMLVASAIVVALVKPYVLFAFVAAAGAFLYGESARRSGRAATIRPVALVVASALAVGGVLALGELFPEFALDHLAESTAIEQAAGRQVRGGSSYSIGDPMARSLGGQLAFAPIAIVSALFRPFLFEASNPQILVNAIEMTIVLLLAIRALILRSWPAMWQDILSSPMLMFCLTFALTFGLPVGLATTNLGTLSRYRMPLVPFFAVALMAWNADLFRKRVER